jgi:D-aminopeptidase
MKRFRDYGLSVGIMPTARLNAITDVPGVRVGHSTISFGEGKLVVGKGPVRTGVTAILPHERNLFREKVRAAIHVINGFGKATGITQVQEMGVIETPIVLTNTLSVGTAWDAVCGFMLDQNPDIGISTGTVNPIIAECNDGFLNDIRGRHVKHKHVLEALKNTSSALPLEGSVGAGTGMSCLGFKGGIGTSSRVLKSQDTAYVLGVLVLANFGRLEDLIVKGVPIGRMLSREEDSNVPPGSIVVVVATNAPVSERQMGRITRRCQAGIARVGSVFASGSGDFVIGFTTANKVFHEGPVAQVSFLDDDSKEMANLFRAAVEATEESILNALFCAKTTIGRDDNAREAIPAERVSSILSRFLKSCERDKA